MLAIVASLKVKPGKEEELEAAMKEMINNVKTEKGTVDYILHESVSEKGKYLFYESYKDQKAIEHHNSTTYMQEFLKKAGPLLAENPVIELFNKLASK